MEGRIFACSWRKQGRKYRVWVKKRPTLFATGQTFGQADLRLWSVIMKATGDGENDRQYDPPAPESEVEADRRIARPGPSDGSSYFANTNAAGDNPSR